jgi:uncharacterized protein YjbI with pentapeptide repeats
MGWGQKFLAPIMAKKAHLVLLRQGIAVWNAWRARHPLVLPDLREADLAGFHLDGVDLRHADLAGGDLQGARLERANLMEADLSGADLRRAALGGANLREARLIRAALGEAHLDRASLMGTNFSGATLRGARFHEAALAETRFIDVDLGGVGGLETCRHAGPSVLDHRTLTRSGPLPEGFLRGCGLSDWEMEAARLYRPGLEAAELDRILYRIHDLRLGTAIQVHNLFISYAHRDRMFVDHLEPWLNRHGIRFWRDVHDAPAGPLEQIVVLAMRQNPTVLLILSQHSVESDWVEYEAQKARELERELGRHVLCPVALDEAWKTSRWSALLRHQIQKYHILDFSNWQAASDFEAQFRRLLEGLDLFYKEEPGRNGVRRGLRV